MDEQDADRVGFLSGLSIIHTSGIYNVHVAILE